MLRSAEGEIWPPINGNYLIACRLDIYRENCANIIIHSFNRARNFDIAPCPLQSFRHHRLLGVTIYQNRFINSSSKLQIAAISDALAGELSIVK